ncbi:PREDICTED: uncharacterized protein LOC109240723 [Nicotiana attenuata]|uniref:DUF4378 domain-containing protein n=1 Tax=Nicotiana attenuata TaxID=49451 RepID=A0A314L999_NICAT|nr:PREDICTED: uncharacterized protein LOC109240723 [Nicotiana attenuata]XP_019262938.1 PREDICTED: uncharacterized protein LOC109240723 [Nicotiana attenuata]OIT37464.1 hypothetical protein A4A49_36921 [Nicotiana attenuata]
MEVEKRSSKGGFLQLFDWNIKSRKKLFSNKSELPENSKQGKENTNGSANLRFQQAHDYGPGSNSNQIYDFYIASSVTEDGSYGQKAPGVVARLMGLDSLPTSKESDPCVNSSFDCHSFRDSPYQTFVADFQNEHHMIVDGNMRNKLDGFWRNPVELKLQKVQSRPIERFQSEVLPPKSAKPISVTQHRLLSPIKSPGFIPPKNAAYILEAAAKIYEQSPRPATREKMQSSGSSSVPLRIRDLKDRMEAAQRQSRIYEAPHRPKEQNSVKHIRRQPSERGQVQSDNTRQFRASEVSRRDVSQNKGKEKSVSLAVQAKTNVQKREGKTSSASKNPANQKEKNDSKPGRSRSSSQKVGERRTSLIRPSDVLRQNNQKQNYASNKDGESSKTSAPYHKEKKVSSTGDMSRPTKTVSRIVVNTTTAPGTASLVGTDAGKELSSSRDSRMRSFTGKKRPVNGDIDSDGCGPKNLMKSKDERSIKCNLTIEGCPNWDTADRKNGSDVVSFTFTSPIKKSLPGSTSSSQVLEKSNVLSLFPGSYDNQFDSRTSTISPLSSNVIGGDDLGMLLEQKLKELTSKVGSSCEDPIKTGTASISANSFEDSVSIIAHGKRPQVDLLHEKADDTGQSFATQMWQGPKMVEKPKMASSFTCEREFTLPCSSPVSSLEPSISGGSCNSLDSYRSLTTDGSKYHLSDGSQEMMNWKTCSRIPLAEGDAELLDSASSVSLADTGGKDSTTASTSRNFDESPYWEFRYIRGIIRRSDLMLEDFLLGEAQSIIALDLFDQLENHNTRTNKNVEEQLKIRRRVLFDSVVECLEFRCKQSSGGSFEAWAKWTALVQRKEWLAEEVYREIAGWTSMEELMVDEVVDKDMSTRHGKWTDFSFEAFEEGVDIEKVILSSLMDELIHDLM